MQTLTALKERTKWAIDYVIEHNDLKPTEIGRIIGSKPDTVRKYREKLSTPSVRFIQRFCTAFEIDFLWLSKGSGRPIPGKDVVFPATQETIDPPPPEPQPPQPQAADLACAPPSEPSPEPYPSSNSVWADSEISLQKLALLSGIKIDTDWIHRLSNAIGVPSWKISLSIHYQQIDMELITAAERRGHMKEKWLVVIEEKKHLSPTQEEAMDISRLLKIAEEVLRSGTIHSTALATNIISLKTVYDRYSATPLMGAKAINLPKSTDLRLVK